MTKQLLKLKGPDGKWQTVASYEMGQYGPRIGINAPVLRQVLEAPGWVNLSVFADDRQKTDAPARSSAPAVPSLDDEVPFAPCMW